MWCGVGKETHTAQEALKILKDMAGTTVEPAVYIKGVVDSESGVIPPQPLKPFEETELTTEGFEWTKK